MTRNWEKVDINDCRPYVDKVDIVSIQNFFANTNDL